MTIKDILELGFGIDFNTLSFNLIKDDFDSKTTVNDVKNMLENYPITISKEYRSTNISQARLENPFVSSPPCYVIFD